MSKASVLSIDLSGAWRLNLTDSTFGNEHPGQDYQLTWKVEQSANSIRITESAKNVSSMNIPLPNSTRITEYRPDGRESEITRPGSFPGMPAEKLGVRAERQGDTFWIVERSYPTASNSITRRRIFLSGDGTKLLELREMSSVFGDTIQKLVFERIH